MGRRRSPLSFVATSWLLPSKKKSPHHHHQQQQDGVDVDVESPYVATTKKSSSNKLDDVTLSLRTVDFLEDVDELQEEYHHNRHHHLSGVGGYEQPHSRTSSAPAAVSFGVVEIRSYKQVLGDHPFCTNGCPIQLGWTYTEESVVGIDEYEQEMTSSSCWNSNSSSSRSRNQYVERLKLTAEERKQILLCGSSNSSSSNDRDNVANGTDENNVTTATTTTTTTGNTPGSPLQLHNLERSLSRECRRLNRETRYRTNNSVYTKHVQREFFGTERKKTNKY
jgi:hypothetical protein